MHVRGADAPLPINSGRMGERLLVPAPLVVAGPSVQPAAHGHPEVSAGIAHACTSRACRAARPTAEPPRPAARIESHTLLQSHSTGDAGRSGRGPRLPRRRVARSRPRLWRKLRRLDGTRRDAHPIEEGALRRIARRAGTPRPIDACQRRQHLHAPCFDVGEILLFGGEQTIHVGLGRRKNGRGRFGESGRRVTVRCDPRWSNSGDGFQCAYARGLQRPV